MGALCPGAERRASGLCADAVIWQDAASPARADSTIGDYRFAYFVRQVPLASHFLNYINRLPVLYIVTQAGVSNNPLRKFYLHMSAVRTCAPCKRRAGLTACPLSLSNKLVDGGASSPATATPSQFPLKCCAFPGAETGRKQFLLRGQAPLRRNCRESGVHAAGFD